MRMGQRLGSRLTVALLAAGVVVAGPGAVGRAVPAAVPPAATAVPAISHAFVIIEENTNFSDVFGARASEAPYLNSLADAHVRHDAYYATSHVSLGNYISMVSGQVPQPLDHFDCPTYAACVRPGPTIGAQLDGAGRTWRGHLRPRGVRRRSGWGTPKRGARRSGRETGLWMPPPHPAHRLRSPHPDMHGVQ